MPFSSVTVGAIALLCFPPDDALFADVARRLLREVGHDEPGALQADLRRIYPLAVVRARETLASFQGPAWYAYRDGRFSPFDASRWWDEPDAARIVVGDDGAYLDATPAALELLGTTLAELRASPSGSFAVPAFRSEMPWVFALLRDTGELHSTSLLEARAGRAEIPVEFRFVRDGAGPGCHVATLRRVPLEAVVPPSLATESAPAG